MEIHMLVLDGKITKDGYIKPTKIIFKGTTVPEDCILKLTETYFGPAIKDKVEDLLKTRIEVNIDEIN